MCKKVKGLCKIDKENPKWKKCLGCLKKVSVGEVNNGLYFDNNQQYLSAISGLVTIIGTLAIFGLSVMVFINIFNKT